MHSSCYSCACVCERLTLFYFTTASAEKLFLSENELTGELPLEIYNLSNLCTSTLDCELPSVVVDLRSYSHTHS